MRKIIYLSVLSLFSATVFAGNNNKEVKSKIVEKLQPKEWKIAKLELDPIKNRNYRELSTPSFYVNFTPSIDKLGNKCKEQISVDFYSIEMKEQILGELNRMEHERVVIFPFTPEIVENDEYLMLIWRPYCINNAKFEDERTAYVVNEINLEMNASPITENLADF